MIHVSCIQTNHICALTASHNLSPAAGKVLRHLCRSLFLRFQDAKEAFLRAKVYSIMNVLDDRLNTPNSAVVLATVKVFLNLTLSMPYDHQQVWHSGLSFGNHDHSSPYVLRPDPWKVDRRNKHRCSRSVCVSALPADVCQTLWLLRHPGS